MEPIDFTTHAVRGRLEAVYTGAYADLARTLALSPTLIEAIVAGRGNRDAVIEAMLLLSANRHS